MEITRNKIETAAGPDDWFTGTVFIDTIATPSEPSRLAAAPDRFMTHLAMQEVDDQGSPVSWGEHVTDEEYLA